MAEGRFFSTETESDRTEAVVVNETAARAMGPGSPLGKRLTITAMSMEGRTETNAYRVIGVMKDFHQSSLRRAIEPMVFTWNGDQGPGSTSASARSASRRRSSSWKKRGSLSSPSSLSPTSSSTTRSMRSTSRTGRTRSILGVFTVLALFTACLGLVGLASFIAEKRTKEIGIRKVLGASTGSLVLMQSREFLVWVLVANAIALAGGLFRRRTLAAGIRLQGRPGRRRRHSWRSSSRRRSRSCRSRTRRSRRPGPIRSMR